MSTKQSVFVKQTLAGINLKELKAAQARQVTHFLLLQYVCFECYMSHECHYFGRMTLSIKGSFLQKD